MVSRYLEYDVGEEHYRKKYTFNVDTGVLLKLKILHGDAFIKTINHFLETPSIEEAFIVTQTILCASVCNDKEIFMKEHVFLMTLSLLSDPMQDLAKFFNDIFDPILLRR